LSAGDDRAHLDLRPDHGPPEGRPPARISGKAETRAGPLMFFFTVIPPGRPGVLLHGHPARAARLRVKNMIFH
jgi:hypothetical protein